MSKFGCICGHVIVDQTDSLPYKAGLLRDQKEETFWDGFLGKIKDFLVAAEPRDIAALIASADGEPAPQTKAADNLVDQLGSIQVREFSTAYECEGCGRLWLEKYAGADFISYLPEGGEYNAILSIAAGESDKRSG
ncbi:hypothetical protein [Pseudomonas marginalis]|uniref:hypothetical protein n=1 Tax=Pseudomonas marginalis TaxID=298 RepID=UPI0005FC0012|nr:hypothetical protein [Pseudomonas marginalis]KJZ52727.1 hypothetical protein VC36_27670 [Pseudomonas marginalis]KJZ53662.1 hypothetical protein VC37_16655 [Pseudomonas marginalis]